VFTPASVTTRWVELTLLRPVVVVHLVPKMRTSENRPKENCLSLGFMRMVVSFQ